MFGLQIIGAGTAIIGISLLIRFYWSKNLLIEYEGRDDKRHTLYKRGFNDEKKETAIKENENKLD